MKTKKILSLLLCLIMMLGVAPISAFAADTRIEVTEIVGTSNMEPPRYGEKVNTYFKFNFTKGKEIRVAHTMSGWQKWNASTSTWENYEAFTFTEGKYKFSTQIRIDGESGYGTTHKLAQNVTVTIDGVSWSYAPNPTIYSTYSYNYITSPEFKVEKPAEIVGSVAVTNLNKPTAGATPDKTATTESTFKIGSIIWYRLENGSWKEMGSYEKFVAGNTYKCYFQILPTDGYIFPVKKDEFSVTINNEAANIVNFSSKLVCVEKEFFVPCISHNFITVDSKDVSCTEDGYTNYECKACGKLKTVIANSTGHNYEKISHMDATCGIAGYTRNKCNTCGDTKIDTIPATGNHSYVEDYKAPTCIEAGYRNYKCSVCEDTKSETFSATGHRNDNGKCVNSGCGYTCSCKCHGNFIQKLIFMITNFFAKLFNPAKRVCECGAGH